MKMKDEFEFSPTQIEWDKRHADILQSFLYLLDQNNIRYLILKNDNGLPFKNFSKDVDIVIEPGQYKKAANLLHFAYKTGGITHYKVNKFERLRCWYGFNVETRLAIHIDLLEGFLHKGFEMFPFEEMYRHSYKNSNGVCVLDDVYGSLLLLLHSTICYHHIKEKYVKQISLEYNRSKLEINNIICKLFPPKASAKLIQLLEKEDYKTIANNGRWFSHQSKKRIFLKRPIFTICNICDFLWEKIQRIIVNKKKYNMFLSVHAPDGTGKTTFIQTLAEQLGFFFVCNAEDLVKIYHFRPTLFPNLGAAAEKMRVMKQDKNFTVPHRAKPANFLFSLGRMAYYWLDYLIGMPLILRKNAKFDKITIFDRYIYDFLVDPYRTRIKLPYWIRRTFTRLVKQPKILFILNAPADVIYARKQELKKEEIERQLIEFRKLSQLGERVHILDATRTPKEIAHEAIMIIISSFAQKI